MKLYNPFKPHIVVDGFGKYYIRIHTIFGWEYWGGSWFYGTKVYANYYEDLKIVLENLHEAKEYLVKEKTRKKILKIKDKVIHTE